MTDYYLEDRTRLKGQPKRTIGDYVESQGILVPRRFDSLKDAKASGKPILLRSEHPLEYGIVSGFFDSFSIDYFKRECGEPESEAGIKDAVLTKQDAHGRQSFIGPFLFENYCKMLGLNFDPQIPELSFSFWENLPGLNRTIIADSSIKGRYHIQTQSSQDNAWIYDYTLVEDDKISPIMRKFYGLQPPEDFQSLVELYERIRNLDKFDPNNCPIIEIQTIGDKHYFLQYHRARDFRQTTFSLHRPAEKDEKEALFVRGHTPEEGTTGKITVHYAFEAQDKSEWKLPESEVGSFDFHYNFAFSTIMYPKRKLQIIHPSYKDNSQWELLKFVGHHSQNSELYLPEVSIICNKGIFKDDFGESITSDQLSKSETMNLYLKAKETGENQGIDMHVVSDGRKAYYRRLD